MPFCAYSLVQHGKDKKDLLKCARCKSTHYADRQCQKAAWKKHKITCRPTTSRELQEIDAMSLATTKNTMKEIFTSGLSNDYSHAIVPLLRHLRKLFDDYSLVDRDHVACDLHAICRGMIFHPMMISLLLNCPGIVDYLFGEESEEDLLSDKCKFVKKHFEGYCKVEGWMNEEYIEAYETDPTKRKKLLEKCNEYTDMKLNCASFSEPPSMKHCYVIFNLLVAAALKGNPSMTSIHDGVGTLRFGTRDNIHLTRAALARCMKLWTDNFVRGSCGDAMAPAASLALTAIETYTGSEDLQATLSDTEVAPGLDIDRLIITTLSEMGERAASKGYSVKCLEFLGRQGSYRQWGNLSNESRAELILTIITYFQEHGTDNEDEPDYGSVAVPKKALLKILDHVIGKDEESGMFVMKLAAENELLGPQNAGKNKDVRAFIHYCIRNQIEIKGKCIVNACNDWKAIPYSKKNAKKEAEKSFDSTVLSRFEEKVECQRLALGKMKESEWFTKMVNNSDSDSE